ncbi:PQQ-dependent sugar dehydrogenase [Sphingosinicella terrae]|uniref:PQQ-dependent sugar dehydrogenase n=1 Tax=Sphingosinicella terrae TaxID=2172047 RepID=UPI000E0DB6A2|nr:sorbosone dehydrogenase family protein [Sphingosinicella terrae]
MRPRRSIPVAASLALIAAGCGDTADLNIAQSTGPAPLLPEPNRSVLPTVHIAEAVGWPAGDAPAAAPGLAVGAFATGLDHPRWLLVLPNGDVLVAESAAPPKPEQYEDNSLKGLFMRMFMRAAGSAVPSANRITLLRDADGDGTAELRSPFLTGLQSPFGMALVGDTLFVANADALLAFSYGAGATRIDSPGRRVVDLPAGRNHHWTKSLAASPDGRRLYVGVGSNSNVAEHGLAEEEGRAAVWEVDPANGTHRLFATGLRNPVGLDFQPGSGDLWVVVNERDELGSDLVPDYLTRVQPGAFYGWPWSYWGQHVDGRVEPPRPDLVARAVVPDYALGSHVAPLGLAFAERARLGPAFASGAFVGLHGSWNRRPFSGYKVVFVPFVGGRPAGTPVDVLTGFLSADGKAMGRPVGVEIGRDGALLVADDVGGAVWRVAAAR